MSFPSRLSFLSPSFVSKEIQGEEVRFYSCSLGAMARMSKLISKLASSFATLIGNGGDRDQGRVFETQTDKATGFNVEHTEIKPITPELAERRGDMRSRAVSDAVDTLLDPRHQLALGELLIDSMREEFPRGQARPNTQQIQEWVSGMDLPMFFVYMTGLAEANAKVFGDLGKSVIRAAKARAAGMLAEREEETAGKP